MRSGRSRWAGVSSASVSDRATAWVSNIVLFVFCGSRRTGRGVVFAPGIRHRSTVRTPLDRETTARPRREPCGRAAAADCPPNQPCWESAPFYGGKPANPYGYRDLRAFTPRRLPRSAVRTRANGRERRRTVQSGALPSGAPPADLPQGPCDPETDRRAAKSGGNRRRDDVRMRQNCAPQSEPHATLRPQSPPFRIGA